MRSDGSPNQLFHDRPSMRAATLMSGEVGDGVASVVVAAAAAGPASNSRSSAVDTSVCSPVTVRARTTHGHPVGGSAALSSVENRPSELVATVRPSVTAQSCEPFWASLPQTSRMTLLRSGQPVPEITSGSFTWTGPSPLITSSGSSAEAGLTPRASTAAVTTKTVSATPSEVNALSLGRPRARRRRNMIVATPAMASPAMIVGQGMTQNELDRWYERSSATSSTLWVTRPAFGTPVHRWLTETLLPGRRSGYWPRSASSIDPVSPVASK